VARIKRGLTLFFLLGVSVAAAQEISPLAPPSTDRYLRWGPFWVRPSLTIPTFGYDDNVFYIPDNSLVPPVGDYFLDISPGVEGLVLFGNRAFVTFAEKLEFYAYANEHDADYFNQFGRARVTFPLGKYGVYVDGGYDRVRDRPADATDIRPIRKEIPFGGGMIFKFGWRTDVEVGYAKTRFTGEDPDDPCIVHPSPNCITIDRRIDRGEAGARLLARYLLFGRTRFTLQASERDIVFDDPSVQRDAHERRVLPGLDFGLGGRVYGNVRVGWANFDLENPAAEDFQGGVADIAVGYRLGGLGSSLYLRGFRDVQYSVLESTDLYTNTGGELTFVRYFNRFIGMELGGGRSTLDFLGDDRKDDILRGSAGVRFRISENDLGRRVEYAFRYVLTRRNSNIPSLDQTRGTIGFGMSFGY
jgi:hypothetical protein